MKITLRATYEKITEGEPAENGDSNPIIEGGYTDPRNPWGGLDVEVPEGLCGPPFAAWRDENADTIVYDDADPTTLDDGDLDDDGEWVTFTALEHAARFIEGFPGGVWDLRETEYATNFLTGAERGVTLHVSVDPADDISLVFDRAEALLTERTA